MDQLFARANNTKTLLIGCVILMIFCIIVIIFGIYTAVNKPAITVIRQAPTTARSLTPTLTPATQYGIYNTSPKK